MFKENYDICGDIILFIEERFTNENFDYLKMYLDLFIRISLHAADQNKKNFIFFYADLLSKLKNIDFQNEYKEYLFKIGIDYAYTLANSDSNYIFLFLSDLERKISDSNSDSFNDILKTIESLFDRIIFQKVNQTYYFLMTILINTIKKLDISNSIQHELIINLFENVFKRNINNNNNEHFGILLGEIKDVIRYLDFNEKLSKSIFIKYCDLIKKLLNYINTNQKFEYAEFLIESLSYIFEEIKIVDKHSEYMIKIIDMIASAGFDSIENNNSLIVRNVSNTLGWLSKKAIDCSKEIVKHIILRELDLFELLLKYTKNEDILIFVGTYFIIIGSYSIFKKKSYHNDIIKNISKLKIEKEKIKRILRISYDLRRLQSETWDDYFEMKSEDYFNDFLLKIDESLNKS